jgi:hypothetical protein
MGCFFKSLIYYLLALQGIEPWILSKIVLQTTALTIRPQSLALGNTPFVTPVGFWLVGFFGEKTPMPYGQKTKGCPWSALLAWFFSEKPQKTKPYGQARSQNEIKLAYYCELPQRGK